MSRLRVAALFVLIVVVFATQVDAQDPSAADVSRIAKIVGQGRYMERPRCQAGQSPATHECCQTVAQDDPLMSTVLAPYQDFRLPVPSIYSVRLVSVDFRPV